MLMEKIRRGPKKHRKLLIAVVVVIAASIVASFAIGGSSKIGAGNNNQDTTQLQIDALNTSIAESKKIADADMSFSESKNLADMLIKLANLQSGKDSAKSAQNALEAAKYYDLTLDKAPAELNNKGKADLIRQKAVALFTAGDAAGAETTLKEALSFAPLDYDANYAYAILLLSNKGFDAAIAYAESYRAKLPADDSNIANADNLISSLKSMKEAQEKDSTDNSGATNKDTSKSGSEESGTPSE